MNLGIFIATLSGASVEFFETAAIGYAIARSGYQREAVWGTIAGLVLVGSASAVLGTKLQLIPIHLLQITVGLVLLWFGWIWYKKAIIRQASHRRAGWVTNVLEAEGIHLDREQRGFSQLNFIIMFKSAALEMLEVAIVVVTLGLASSAWDEALIGAGVAFLLTLSVVAMLHGYLIKVPDVLLKLSAGILLLSFGTFWLGQGLGFDWFIEDWALLILVGFYSLLAALAIHLRRIK